MTAALLSSPALAQNSDWTIGSRTLPAPAGASDALRAAIANTPQPNVVEHIRQTPTTKEEWVSLIRAANERAEALIERGAVTVKMSGVSTYETDWPY